MEFLKLPLSLGLYFLLIEPSVCRPTNNPGSVTQTSLANFPFRSRIANPCQISSMGQNQQLSSSQQKSTSPPVVVFNIEEFQSRPNVELYRSIVGALDLAKSQVNLLESSDPNFPECNGISLDSLPSTPILDSFNDAEAMQQAYKTGIFLTTHFRLMYLDRQVAPNGETDVPDSQLEDDVPTWRFLRCGNESEALPTKLQDVINEMENFVCTVLNGASEEQRTSFRNHYNQLEKTVLYRYHSSCTAILTRDCLVVREAKQALNLIHMKFLQLANATNEAADSFEFDNGISNLI